MHRWDEIRRRATTISMSFLKDMGGSGVHESLFRSHAILGEVMAMLKRGDSPETIARFIEWAEQRDAD